MIDLYKENINVGVEKKEMGRDMEGPPVKVEIVLGAKETITLGVETKTKGDLIV